MNPLIEAIENMILLAALQGLMGHSNRAMTERYQSHNPTFGIESANTIEKAMFGKK